MTLDQVSTGIRCRVKTITAEGALGDRLSALGLYPGKELTVVRQAPFRDPLEVVIEGYYLSIRRAEAAFVETESL